MPEFVTVIKKNTIPHVRLERRVHQNGEVRDTFELVIYECMPFVVLLHEMDHIEQILTRFLAQGQPFFTSVFEETSRGWRNNQDYPGVVKNWQNTILEYEVRLLEFKRLYDNNADEQTTKEAARQGIIWSQKYWGALGLGKSSSRVKWANTFAPNLGDLRAEMKKVYRQTGFRFSQHQIAKKPLI